MNGQFVGMHREMVNKLLAERCDRMEDFDRLNMEMYGSLLHSRTIMQSVEGWQSLRK